MEIWNYHPITGELLGPSVADPNPVEPGEWLVAAHATPVAPPARQDGRALVFAGSSWANVLDHRGETWWVADATDNTAPHVILAIGDPTTFDPPLTSVEPPAPPAPPPPPVVATPEQLFAALAASMGKTPAEIDALFALAKSL